MKLGLLTGSTAAFLIIGAAGAQAQTVYIEEPGAVEMPGYVYVAPTVDPAYPGPYAVTVPGYEIVERPPVVVTPRRGYVVERPAPFEPREVIDGDDDDDNGIITTGTSALPQCAIDAFGFERCY
jgi:hypothetical protein